ncbi:Tat pathway signal sequence domain protein [Streptomyces sp. NPDC047079]|uniref:Tat pathway signal sequence domain protein n=1 Tax=Streptomyces sp. NPDC047079 TaxID=3154607 RepID=UPI0034005422
MSGVGPVEPGEGTRARDDSRPDDSPPPGRPPQRRLARLHDRHRPLLLAATAVAALLAAGGYLYATRQQKPPSPPPPYPSQVVTIAYLHTRPTPRGAPPRSFSLSVRLSVESGPPVTVTRIAQPYAGLSVTSIPRPPFRTEAGSARKIAITMQVTECGKAPENAGLPFLDVTLRNTRAIEDHSYILGPRYAHDLSAALHVACGNHSR